MTAREHLTAMATTKSKEAIYKKQEAATERQALIKVRAPSTTLRTRECLSACLSSHYLCTVRLEIVGNEIFQNVGKSKSCMVSKLPIIFKRTRMYVYLGS